MKRSIFTAALVSLGATLLQATTAHATLIVSGTISSQQLSPTSYKYTLSLTNSATSTDSARSLWFAWFPFYDLLPSAPTAFSAPTGWTGINAPDAIGVASAQFTTTTAPLAPGSTLSGFTFTTPDSPAVLAGTSYFNTPIEQTYVFSIAPQGGTQATPFVPTTLVPEPASVAMLLGAPIALLTRRKRS